MTDTNEKFARMLRRAVGLMEECFYNPMPRTEDEWQPYNMSDPFKRICGRFLREARALLDGTVVDAGFVRVTEVEGVYRLSTDGCHEGIEDGNLGDDIARRFMPDGVDLGEPNAVGPRMIFRVKVTATPVDSEAPTGNH